MTAVKICGLKTPEMVELACDEGARYVGFVFFQKSPRYVDASQARELAMSAKAGVAKVGLFVNPELAEIEGVLNETPLDMIQLHGSETPDHVGRIRSAFGLPIIKAFGIQTADDLAILPEFEAADQFLLDAKAPETSPLPGGNGIRFDWQILHDAKLKKPWLLAGGLTPENVAEAIAKTGAQQVDVSSGVESAAGVKDAEKIRAFLKAAKAH